MINAIINLFEIHRYFLYLNIVFPAFLKHLFNSKQLLYGRSSLSEAGLIFSNYVFCVWLQSKVYNVSEHFIVHNKAIPCGSHKSVYRPSYGWDKLYISSVPHYLLLLPNKGY